MPSKKSNKKTTASDGAQPDNIITFPPTDEDSASFPEQMSLDEARAPIDEAEDIMYDAWECTDPDQRIALARRAIKVSPLCADAFIMLAELAATNPGDKLAYYQQAVAAGTEALGSGAFEEYAGHFWGVMETRPYMRARAGLAEALWQTGAKDQAIEHYRAMLSLNPNDNQGIRYILASKLLTDGRIESLRLLLNEHTDELSTDILYTRALIAYLDGAHEAEELARLGWQCNQHVPGILSGRLPKETLTDYISFGGKDQATSYVVENGEAWESVPGAISWLEDVTKGLKPRR